MIVIPGLTSKEQSRAPIAVAGCIMEAVALLLASGLPVQVRRHALVAPGPLLRVRPECKHQTWQALLSSGRPVQVWRCAGEHPASGPAGPTSARWEAAERQSACALRESAVPLAGGGGAGGGGHHGAAGPHAAGRQPDRRRVGPDLCRQPRPASGEYRLVAKGSSDSLPQRPILACFAVAVAGQRASEPAAGPDGPRARKLLCDAAQSMANARSQASVNQTARVWEANRFLVREPC